MRRSPLVLAAAAALGLASCAAPPIDLGTFGGASSRAFGINAQGVVVGDAQTPDGAWHAFASVAYTGAKQDLHGIQPPGLDDADKGRSTAYAANSRGIVAGTFGSSTAVAWNTDSQSARVLAGPNDPTLVQCRQAGTHMCSHGIGDVNERDSVLASVIANAPGIGNGRTWWTLHLADGSAHPVPFTALDLGDDDLVVGWASEAASPDVVTPYTWRPGTTRAALPTPAGWNARAWGVTGDGTIVGDMASRATLERRLVRWPAGGGQPVTIPVASPATTHVREVASDGIALAEVYDGTGTQFVAVNTTTGATAPITSGPSSVTAVNGTHAVGTSVPDAADPSATRAARWERPTP